MLSGSRGYCSSLQRPSSSSSSGRYGGGGGAKDGAEPGKWRDVIGVRRGGDDFLMTAVCLTKDQFACVSATKVSPAGTTHKGLAAVGPWSVLSPGLWVYEYVS